ncbi:hypothetical protein HJC99_00695 [Candidatus Saccharibacteria bacterium]|nr:hypothetical protein [Candidatus Saccharibacteria bacterium]
MNWLSHLPVRLRQLWDDEPAVRLAAGYAFILLILSLIFSFVLYHFAVGQLARGLNHQYLEYRGEAPTGPFDPSHIPTGVQSYLDDGRHNLILNLVYFNVVIIVLGAGLSYLLAKRTFRPIEEALASQRRFASDASHELRTPLAVMQTEIEIARADPRLSRDEAIELLGSNLDEVKKLHQLSDSLLRLARSEGRSLTLTNVSLSRVADDAVDRLAGAAKAKRIQLINDTTAVIVLADHETLAELAAILLDNAIKYSPDGSTVTLTTAVQGHAGWLTIIDHGPGIAASDLPHIFDRFYRADKSRTGGQASGHGLGLSLAKHIAELNEAEIVATSQLGKGSSFTIKARLGEDELSQLEG